MDLRGLAGGFIGMAPPLYFPKRFHGARLCGCAKFLEEKKVSDASTIRAVEVTSEEARPDIYVKFPKFFLLVCLVQVYVVRWICRLDDCLELLQLELLAVTIFVFDKF